GLSTKKPSKLILTGYFASTLKKSFNSFPRKSSILSKDWSLYKFILETYEQQIKKGVGLDTSNMRSLDNKELSVLCRSIGVVDTDEEENVVRSVALENFGVRHEFYKHLAKSGNWIGIDILRALFYLYNYLLELSEQRTDSVINFILNNREGMGKMKRRRK
ncbi:MAG: hypothetical protein ACPGYV_14550, partial [Phycisphaeraceae bacterium]